METSSFPAAFFGTLRTKKFGWDPVSSDIFSGFSFLFSSPSTDSVGSLGFLSNPRFRPLLCNQSIIFFQTSFISQCTRIFYWRWWKKDTSNMSCVLWRYRVDSFQNFIGGGTTFNLLVVLSYTESGRRQSFKILHLSFPSHSLWVFYRRCKLW